MASLTITIPDEAVTRVVSALGIDSEENAEIKSALESWLKKKLKREVIRHEIKEAKKSAQILVLENSLFTEQPED